MVFNWEYKHHIDYDECTSLHNKNIFIVKIINIRFSLHEEQCVSFFSTPLFFFISCKCNFLRHQFTLECSAQLSSVTDCKFFLFHLLFGIELDRNFGNDDLILLLTTIRSNVSFVYVKAHNKFLLQSIHFLYKS